MTWITNQWYVAAWDNEIDNAPTARTICGEDVVIYRRLNGSVVVLRDACPHRLLPLSMGIKEGDNIRCKYHGLMLNPEGKTIEMPLKNERVNPNICVQKYAVIERYRYIWIWIGDQEKADPALLPDLWQCEHPDWAFEGDYYHLNCDYRLAIDNLMDLTHETHVHSSSIGQPELLEAPIETRSVDDRVLVSRWMSNVNAPPFWRSLLGSDGAVDRWQICEFILPSNVLIDVGVAPVEVGSTLEDHDGGVRGFVVDSLTPETETTCHYFWGMTRNFNTSEPGLGERIRRQQGTVFLEDVEILEAQQRSIENNSDMSLLNLSIDSGGLRARRLIEKRRQESLSE